MAPRLHRRECRICTGHCPSCKSCIDCLDAAIESQPDQTDTEEHPAAWLRYRRRLWGKRNEGRGVQLGTGGKDIDEGSCPAIVAHHAVAAAADDVQVAVRPKLEALRIHQAAAGSKDPEKSSRGSVVTADIVRGETADIKIASRPEGQASGPAEASPFGEGVDERPRHAVEAQHAVADLARHIKVAVAAKGQIERCRGSTGKDLFELAGLAIVAADSSIQIANQVEVPIRPEGQPERSAGITALGEMIDVAAAHTSEPFHAAGKKVADIQIAVRTIAQARRLGEPATGGKGSEKGFGCLIVTLYRAIAGVADQDIGANGLRVGARQAQQSHAGHRQGNRTSHHRCSSMNRESPQGEYERF